MPKGTWGAAVAASVLAIAGCDPQASPEYRGEALLTIAGSVEVDSDRERGPLLPGDDCPEIDWEALNQLEIESDLGLECPAADVRVDVVDDPENHPISVRIGADVFPGF